MGEITVEHNDRRWHRYVRQLTCWYRSSHSRAHQNPSYRGAVVAEVYLEVEVDLGEEEVVLGEVEVNFSLVAYKPASAYLDSPLQGSTPIFRGAVNLSALTVPSLQLLCEPRAFRKDLSLALCFFPYSSHPLHILSVHMASCSSSTLTTLSSMSPYSKTITILQCAKLEFVSRPSSIPGSARTG